MLKPGFIVEGQMEQKIIQILCPHNIVRRIGCNGEKVKMAVMAKFINVQITTMKHCNPIVIIFDREKRVENCQTLRDQLSTVLDELGNSGKYIIGIADRTLESWILADWRSILSIHSDFKQFNKASEATNGKAELKKLLPPTYFYNETTVGPSLFCETSAANIYKGSPSFASFVDLIKFKCKWLSTISTDYLPI